MKILGSSFGNSTAVYKQQKNKKNDINIFSTLNTGFLKK